jgi:hypothetical protein
MQNQPPSKSYFLKTPQLKQLHLFSSISSFGFSEAPRAQKRAFGATSFNLFGLKVGQGPQNCLQMFIFSSLSGTF